jgi:hypothetical protein
MLPQLHCGWVMRMENISHSLPSAGSGASEQVLMQALQQKSVETRGLECTA